MIGHNTIFEAFEFYKFLILLKQLIINWLFIVVFQIKVIAFECCYVGMVLLLVYQIFHCSCCCSSKLPHFLNCFSARTNLFLQLVCFGGNVFFFKLHWNSQEEGVSDWQQILNSRTFQAKQSIVWHVFGFTGSISIITFSTCTMLYHCSYGAVKPFFVISHWQHFLCIIDAKSLLSLTHLHVKRSSRSLGSSINSIPHRSTFVGWESLILCWYRLCQ